MVKNGLRPGFVLAAAALMALCFVAGTQYRSAAANNYLIAGAAGGGSGGRTPTVENVSLRPVEDIQAVMSLLRDYYVSGIPAGDEAKLTYTAIRGLLYGLGDPYTRFMDPTEYRSFTEENDGHFDGIGATLEMAPTAEMSADAVTKPGDSKDKDVATGTLFRCPVCLADTSNPMSYRIVRSSAKGFEAEYVQEPPTYKHYRITVVTPIPGGPAEKMGIKSGDQILKVDDTSTHGMAISEAVKRIKGPAGTTVSLLILRKGAAKPIEFKVVRGKIDIPTVETKVMPGNIGYLRLNIFNGASADKTAEGLKELRAKGMKGLLLDLRGNPGGGLEVCLQIASMMIPEGPLVHIKAKGQDSVTRSAPKESHGLGMPIVVLVNHGSASASEILSGAMQDRGVAKLVGERTFGKGLVQTVIRLKDSSAVAITTAKYYTPKHHEVNHLGITPDVQVAEPAGPPIELMSDKDVQATAAVKLLTTEITSASTGNQQSRLPAQAR